MKWVYSQPFKMKQKKQGIDLAYKQIPPEVFDKRAVAKGEVQFHDVAYIEFTPIIKGEYLSS